MDNRSVCVIIIMIWTLKLWMWLRMNNDQFNMGNGDRVDMLCGNDDDMMLIRVPLIL